MVVLANIVIFSFGAFFLIDLLRSLPEPLGAYGVGALLFAVYAGLIWFCSRYPDLAMDAPSAPALSLPVPGPTKIGSAHACTPVTNAHPVCLLPFEQNTQHHPQLLGHISTIAYKTH